MIDIRIIASEQRRKNVEKLLKALGKDEKIVHWDTYKDPTPYERFLKNCKSAWMQPYTKKTTHRIVLADDVSISEGFMEIAQKCADNFPEAIWSFVSTRVPEQDVPYQIMASHFPIGAAMMIPVAYINEIFSSWAPTKDWGLNTDETRVERYVLQHNVKLMTTFPNIADHLMGDSILRDGAQSEAVSATFEASPDMKRFDATDYGVTI